MVGLRPCQAHRALPLRFAPVTSRDPQALRTERHAPAARLRTSRPVRASTVVRASTSHPGLGPWLELPTRRDLQHWRVTFGGRTMS